MHLIVVRVPTVLGALCVDAAGRLGAGVLDAPGVGVPFVPRGAGAHLNKWRGFKDILGCIADAYFVLSLGGKK